MFRSYILLVYTLLTAEFTEGMRARRGFQIAAPTSQQVAEAAEGADLQANEAALVSILGVDPCWQRPMSFNGVHAADTNCARAAAAFNSRDEHQRRNCRYTVAPKCRFFGRGTIVMQCSVKKIRPRSHFFCMAFGMTHEVVDLASCARPVYPNLPYVAPPQLAVHLHP